jgi:hypothetical protein
MKLKYSLSAWLLPKLKQNNSHNPTVINRRNKEQKYFVIALLLLWLLIYLLVPGKAHGQTANGLTIGQQVPDITIPEPEEKKQTSAGQLGLFDAPPAGANKALA